MAFNPLTDVTSATCVLWLDANDTSTTDAVTGLTYNFSDKSGAGNHATGQTGRPASFHPCPNGNGKRVAMVHGAGNVTTSGHFSINGVASRFSSPFTLFFVGVYDYYGSNNSYAFGAGRSSAATPYFVMFTRSGPTGKFTANYSGTEFSSSQNCNKLLNVVAIRGNGTTLAQWVNGVASGSAARTLSGTFDQASIGGWPTNGAVVGAHCVFGTVIMYSGALSDADLAIANASLTADWVQSPAGELTLPWIMDERDKTLLGPHITEVDGVIDTPFRNSLLLPGGTNKIYYCNSETGSDANPGTAGSPYKTPAMALAQTDVDAVCLAAGVYNGWNNTYTRPQRSVIVYCPSPGMAYIGNIEDVQDADWSLTSGRTVTYQYSTATTPAEVFDVTEVDANDEPQPFVSRASIALVEATAGSYYYDTVADLLYVHTWTSRVPDRYTIVRIGDQVTRVPFNLAGRFIVEINIARINAVMNDGSGNVDIANTTYFRKNVKHISGNSAANSEIWTNCKEIYWDEGGGVRLTNDCVNTRGASRRISRALTIRCSNPSSQASNTETLHDAAIGFSINNFLYGGRRTYHNIGTSRCWMVGGCVKDAQTGGAETGYGVTAGDTGLLTGGTSNSGVRFWLYKVEISGASVLDVFCGVADVVVIYGYLPQNLVFAKYGAQTLVFPERRWLKQPGYALNILTQSGVPLRRNL